MWKLNDAKTELNVSQKRVSLCQSLLSGPSRIRGLPEEILREIFLYSKEIVICYQHKVPHQGTDTLTVHSSGNILLQVCSQWRSILLGSPILWDSISFMARLHPAIYAGHIHTAISCKPQQGAEVLSSILRRSHKQLISLRIHYVHAEDKGTSQHVDAILRKLVGESRRWAKVEMHVDQLSSVNSVLYRVRGRLDNINAFSLRVDKRAADEVGSLAVFSNAPKLKKLVLWDYLVFDAPWHQLETLELNAPSPMLTHILPSGQLRFVLMYARRHQHLTVRRCTPPLLDADTQVIPLVTQTASMTIQISDIPSCLQHVRFSYLTHLVVSNLNPESLQYPKALLSLLHGVSKTLRELTLEYTHLVVNMHIKLGDRESVVLANSTTTMFNYVVPHLLALSAGLRDSTTPDGTACVSIPDALPKLRRLVVLRKDELYGMLHSFAIDIGNEAPRETRDVITTGMSGEYMVRDIMNRDVKIMPVLESCEYAIKFRPYGFVLMSVGAWNSERGFQ